MMRCFGWRCGANTAVRRSRPQFASPMPPAPPSIVPALEAHLLPPMVPAPRAASLVSAPLHGAHASLRSMWPCGGVRPPQRVDRGKRQLPRREPDLRSSPAVKAASWYRVDFPVAPLEDLQPSPAPSGLGVTASGLSRLSLHCAADLAGPGRARGSTPRPRATGAGRLPGASTTTEVFSGWKSKGTSSSLRVDRDIGKREFQDRRGRGDGRADHDVPLGTIHQIPGLGQLAGEPGPARPRPSRRASTARQAACARGNARVESWRVGGHSIARGQSRRRRTPAPAGSSTHVPSWSMVAARGLVAQPRGAGER
jgi:hypothetical protein